MPKDAALFLDFDGMICDSYVECFSSSWYAYHHLFLGLSVDYMNIADKQKFRNLRPFVRNSEDNVVIQHILDKKISVSNQEEFDRVCSDIGQDGLERYRECFYRARDYFLDEYREFWLGLNYLFGPLVDPLKTVIDNPFVFILSTKKPAFIDEILKHNDINWAWERILEAHGRSKESIILSAIDTAGAGNAVFIDDQIDHLRANGGGRIECYLAEWGYVTEDALKDFSVPHIDLRSCARLINDYRGAVS